MNSELIKRILWQIFSVTRINNPNIVIRLANSMIREQFWYITIEVYLTHEQIPTDDQDILLLLESLPAEMTLTTRLLYHLEPDILVNLVEYIKFARSTIYRNIYLA